MIAPTVLTALQRVITVISAVLTVTLAVAEAADADTTAQYNHVFDYDAPPRTEIQLLPNLNHKGSFIVGSFYPGDAFHNDADSALFVELKLQYEF